MSQLPPDIKKELPEISINAHIYSNSAASRMVSINGNLIREGETVTGGLTLKKITASGIILTYKDHLFRIRAF
jgi:general secretion pathway protein B